MLYVIPTSVESNLVINPEYMMLEPVYGTMPAIMNKPTIKIPKSIKRQYSEGELATAATMMEKLRQRKDMAALVSKLPESNRYDSDQTLDRAIEKLLDVI